MKTLTTTKSLANKIILVDCDGVLLDWNTSFHDWVIETFGYTLVDAFAYHIDKRYGLPNRDHARHLVEAFNNSSAVASLRPFRDAVAAVRSLHFRHGFRFRVISSLSSEPKALAARRKNLYAVFGVEPWEEIICLPCGAEKDEALEPFRESGLFFIEDKLENALTAKRLGIRPILLSASYNLSKIDHQIPRYHEWAQVSEHILFPPTS